MGKKKLSGRSKNLSSKNKLAALSGNVAIVYRPHKPQALKIAREVSQWLRERGYKVYAAPEQKIDSETPSLTDVAAKNLGLVVALGGDGTYLRAVHLVNRSQAPILGINLGSLGFLAENRIEDLYEALADTLAGRMEKRARAILRIGISDQKRGDQYHLALNDVVIERGANSHLMNIELCANQQAVFSVKADGLIIASPTGSTAYNLSAGGPILHPAVNALVVTPICPHSLTHRPMIFPDHYALQLRLSGSKHSGQITIDGQKYGTFRHGQTVTIERHSQDHFVVHRPQQQDYFSILREKLKFGQRD